MAYSTLDLDIIAVTGMKGGKCVMGIDGNDRIRRPIYRTEVESCCWPRQSKLYVGSRYRFTLQGKSSPTPFPHQSDDTLVRFEFKYIGKSDKAKLYSRLRRKAVEMPEKIFPESKYGRYVIEDTVCDSVGVLRCTEGDLSVTESPFNESKNRLEIELPGRSDYNLPITGFTRDLPPRLMNNEMAIPSQSNNEALVLLGLARPWDKNGECYPLRCYVLVLNVFFNEGFPVSSRQTNSATRQAQAHQAGSLNIFCQEGFPVLSDETNVVNRQNYLTSNVLGQQGRKKKGKKVQRSSGIENRPYSGSSFDAPTIYSITNPTAPSSSLRSQPTAHIHQRAPKPTAPSSRHTRSTYTDDSLYSPPAIAETRHVSPSYDFENRRGVSSSVRDRQSGCCCTIL